MRHMLRRVRAPGRLALGRAMKNPFFTLETLAYGVLFFRDLRIMRQKLRSRFPEEFEAGNWRIMTGASAGLKEVALYLIVRKRRPQLMVETGVAQGVSTYFILKAMRDNRRGTLISVDLPNYNKGDRVLETYIPAGLKPGWLVTQELSKRWELMIGSSHDVLPRIRGKIDGFLHDSMHDYDYMTFELEWALSALCDGGFIICDDSWWNTAWSDFARRHRSEVKLLRSPVSTLSRREREDHGESNAQPG